jgi:sugar porter (SP) family MFS transporter
VIPPCANATPPPPSLPAITPLARLSAAAAGMAGLLFGFDTAVISGTTAALQRAFALSPVGLGLAVSIALWGTLVGAAAAGHLGDRLGSRRVLFWIGWLYVVSALGSAMAGSLPAFCLFRVAGGLAIGASSVLAPVYIAEISAPHVRGRWVGLFQFSVVAGILAAYVSNGVVALAIAGDAVWRIKLGVAVVPALLFTLALPFIPDSPRWLRTRGRIDQAHSAGLRLGVMLDPGDTEPAGGPRARLDWRIHRRPILLAIALGAFNQLSGINAILYYLNDIFAGADFSGFSGDMQAVAIGLANLVATMAGMALIDRAGRKPLLIAGALGTCAALAGVALIYASGTATAALLPLLITFIGFFGISQGAVIWVYLAEIFPTDVRARGQSVGSTTHWVLNAAISFAFPMLATHSRAVPFAVFALAMAIQALAVWRWFPETRGIPLEQLAARLQRDPRPRDLSVK